MIEINVEFPQREIIQASAEVNKEKTFTSDITINAKPEITGVTATVDSNTGTPSVDVTPTGTGTDYSFDLAFHNLKGEQGEQGIQGIQGIQGEQGIQGIQGETGNGVSGTEKISTSGLVDTYRMTYTNGNYFDFTVTNGKDAANAVTDVKVNNVSVVEDDVANITIPTNVSAFTNDANYIQNIATGLYALTIYGSPSNSTNALNIGRNSKCDGAGVALGNGAKVISGLGNISLGNTSESSGYYASAIGVAAKANADGAIQLGFGSNSTSKSFCVGFYHVTNPKNYELLDGTTGLIPDDRISTNIARASSLSAVATSGDYDDLLNKPTIPAAQIQSDWDQSDTTAVDYIKNKPYIPSGVIVDQVYDSTSTNAQSGVAIAGAGFATETWVGNQGYITGISSGDVTGALGYTPYDSSNPSGYISGITSSDVTTALGYTPVNKAGDTMTGGLRINDDKYSINGTFPTATPSSNTYLIGYELYGNDTRLGLMGLGYYASGNTALYLQHERTVSGTIKYSTLQVGIDDSGNGFASCPKPSASSDTNSIATTEWVNDKLYYRAGDTVTSLSNYIVAGYLTSSKTRLRFSIPLPKRMNKINTVTINTLVINARQGQAGYLPSATWNAKTGSTVSASFTDNMLQIECYSTTAFTSFTNNVIVNVEFDSFKCTFS